MKGRRKRRKRRKRRRETADGTFSRNLTRCLFALQHLHGHKSVSVASKMISSGDRESVSHHAASIDEEENDECWKLPLSHLGLIDRIVRFKIRRKCSARSLSNEKSCSRASYEKTRKREYAAKVRRERERERASVMDSNDLHLRPWHGARMTNRRWEAAAGMRG